jgi:hypothetical protein
VDHYGQRGVTSDTVSGVALACCVFGQKNIPFPEVASLTIGRLYPEGAGEKDEELAYGRPELRPPTRWTTKEVNAHG